MNASAYTVSAIERMLIEYANIYDRKKELDIKMHETLQYKENAENTLRATVAGVMPKNKNVGDPVYQAVQKIMDEFQVYLDYYQRELQELSRKEISMHEALKCLEPNENRVIELRYFSGCRWEVVASRMHYCEKQCRNIRDEAVKKLGENYRTEVKNG